MIMISFEWEKIKYVYACGLRTLIWLLMRIADCGYTIESTQKWLFDAAYYFLLLSQVTPIYLKLVFIQPKIIGNAKPERNYASAYAMDYVEFWG